MIWVSPCSQHGMVLIEQECIKHSECGSQPKT